MEENKKNEQAVVNGNKEGGNGGRRRRNRNRHKNNGNSAPAQAQNAQNQPSQGKPQQPQKQKGEQGKQNAQNGGKQKNKNKQGNNGQNAQPQKQQPPQQKQQQKGQNNKNGGGKDKSNEKKEENRKDTYLYVLDGNLYVNLTNKCSNACDFCVRNERSSYFGNYLWLKNGEPSAEKVMAIANGYGDLTRFKEAVFCGFGEPTYKVAEMVALCDYFHEKGLKTRLNTNGQGNLINKRDIVPDLKGKIDFVNISLNASCYEKYQAICRSQYREAGFDSMIEFAKSCRRNGIDCRFSIVDCIGEEEVQACKYLAESVKIPLYVRKYIQDS
ncbi:MAG: radical SAM protein [Clostridia bacterium]|nr:radical SAM protein [Clostridia bacterium]MBP3422632.1 radical SAM protein [Clostridia bacterium]